MAGFNDIKDGGLISRRGEELLKQRSDRIQQQSVSQFRIAEKLAEKEKELEEFIASRNIALEKNKERLTQISVEYDNLMRLSKNIGATSQYAAQKQFVSSARTLLSPRAMTEDITAISRSSQNLSAGLTMARDMSTFQLEEQASKARLLMQRNQPRILEAAQNIDQQGGQEKFRQLMRIQDKLAQQAGLADAAMRSQKKLGIDISSRYFGAEQTMSRIRQDQQTEQIREDVAAGRVGSKADVQQDLKLAAEDLAAVFDKLSDAIAKKTDDAKDLGEEFAKLEDQYKKHQQTLKEMDRQGGGGSFAERLKEAGGIISDIGVITQGLAQGYRTNYITSEIQQTQNRIGYAQIANQRFEDVYGSTQGDMSALRRVLSNQFEEQARRGAEYRDREQLSVGGETLGRGGQLVGRVLDEATSMESVWQGLKGGVASGPMAKVGAIGGVAAQVGAASTPDALEFNRLLTDYRKDISAGRTDIQVQNQFRQLQDTISKISDFSSQQTFDYYKDLTLATRGLGLGTNFGPTGVRAYQGTGMMGRNANAAVGMLDTGAAPVEAIPNIPLDNLQMRGTGLIDHGARQRQQSNYGFPELDPNTSDAIKNYIMGVDPGLVSPTDGLGRVTSRYGPRRAPTDALGRSGSSMHRGVDVGLAQGTELKAMGDWEAMGNYYDPGRDGKIGFGNYSTFYDENRDMTFLYAHLQQKGNIAAGSRVGRGQTVGLSGTAGTGPHADFRVMRGRHARYNAGATIDPFKEGIFTEDMFGGGRSVSSTPAPFDREVLTGGATSQGVVSSMGTIGGGGDRELVMSTLMNQGIIGQLANQAGLGTKDVPRIIAGFRGAIGKELTGGLTGQAGVDTLMGNVTRAGELARAGYLESPDQYIQARGQLTGVGGGAEDFEKILRQAVATGMDSSKNIMEMVGAVSEMNQRSASFGLDSAAAATNVLGRGIQDLRASGVERNMAVRAAQLGAQKAEEFTTSTDLDLYNVAEFTGLRNEFGDAKFWELDTLARTSSKDLEQLSRLQGTKGKEKEAKQFAERLGLGTILTDKAKTDKALNISTGSAMDRLLGVGLDEDLAAEIKKYQEGGLLPSEMSSEARSYLGAMGVRVGAPGQSTAASLQYRRGAAEKEAFNVPQGTFTTGGEKGLQAGAIGDAKVFADGVKNFSEAIGGIQQVGEIMKSISEKGLNLQSFKDDVAESAKEMQAPLKQFAGNIGQFNKSIENFDKRMNLLIEKVDAVMQKKMPNVPGIDSQGTKGKKK